MKQIKTKSSLTEIWDLDSSNDTPDEELFPELYDAPSSDDDDLALWNIEINITPGTSKRHRWMLTENEFIHEFTSRGWTCERGYLLKLHEMYESNSKFRRPFDGYFETGKLANHHLEASIRERSKGFNTVIMVTGPTGMGKSLFALGIITFICRVSGAHFNLHMNPRDPKHSLPRFIDPSCTRWQEVYMGFGFDHTVELSKLLREGDSIVQDETKRNQGKDKNKVRDELSNILDISSRLLDMNYTFLRPSPYVLDSVRWYVRVIARNDANWTTIGMLFQRDLENTHWMYIGLIEIDVSQPPEILDYYRRICREEKEGMRDAGGVSKVETFGVDDAVDALLEAMAAADREFHSQIDVEILAVKVPVVQNNRRSEEICHEALQKWQTQHRGLKAAKLARSEGNGTLRFDKRAFLHKKYVQSGKLDEDAFNIYYLRLDGLTQSEIAKRDEQHRSRQRIGQLENRATNVMGARDVVQGLINLAMGHDWEKQLDHDLQLLYKGTKAVVTYEGGDQGLSDHVVTHENGDIDVINAKASDVVDNVIYIPRGKITPEIDRARVFHGQYPENRVRLFVYLAHLPSDRVIQQEVDYLSGDERDIAIAVPDHK